MPMRKEQRNTFLYIFCGIILVVGITLAIYFGVASPPASPAQRFPRCFQIQSPTYRDQNLKLIGNGRCDRQVEGNLTYGLNTIECGYDDGDCNDFNDKYKGCDDDKHPSLLYDFGKGLCNAKYNTEDCGFDDGLCNSFNKEFPKCRTKKPALVGDGNCDHDGDANVEECGYDGGDCLNEKLPRCVGINVDLLGDGKCHREVNTKECNFDSGDCRVFNQNFGGTNCDPPKPYYLYDQICDNGPPGRNGKKEYNNEECGYDRTACERFNDEFGENCYAEDILLLGDGKCHNDRFFNSAGCDFDGRDCTEFNAKRLTNCNVFNGKAVLIFVQTRQTHSDVFMYSQMLPQFSLGNWKWRL